MDRRANPGDSPPVAARGAPLLATERIIAGRLARLFAWFGVFIAVTSIPIILTLSPAQWPRLLVPTVGGLVGGTALLILRSGHPRAAAGFVLWGTWAVVALGSAVGGGITAPGLPGTLVFAAFATLVLGLRHGLALWAATTVLCVLLVVCAPPPHAWPEVPPGVRILIYGLLGLMTVLLLWSTATMLRTSALRAHAEAAQRAAAEHQLEASQAQLRAANAELEARVAERTAQLAAANQELEAFSYSVAHDLRAPLRVIDGFSAAIAAELAPVLTDEARADLARVRAAARRMGGQIDGLLRLSRLTRTGMNRGATDLAALANEAIQALRQGEPGRQVDVEIASGLLVDADPGLMRVLLDNLLGNAWKYSARMAPARIAVGSAEVGGERGYFVRDNGAGFDMAHAGRLFTPFQRLHGEHEYEGTGIGLATVQRIVARHGGRVWAEAAVDQGATFWFTLPRAP